MLPAFQDDIVDDPFDFVFPSQCTATRVREKRLLRASNLCYTYKYVVGAASCSLPLTSYMVKETAEIELTSDKGLMTEYAFQQLSTFWSEWIHLSCFSPHFGIRAVAFRTSPRLPGSAQQALNDFLKLHDPGLDERHNARRAVSNSVGNSTDVVRMAIIMEYFESLDVKEWSLLKKSNKLKFEEFMNIAVQCCLALSELHRLGLVLNLVDITTVLIDPQSGLLKVGNYAYTQPLNRQALTWLSTPSGFSVAPERTRTSPLTASFALILQPATFSSDIYALGRLLRGILRHCVEQSDDNLAIKFAEEFIRPMLLEDPAQRPTAEELLTDERFKDFLELVNVGEIVRRAREMYARDATIYGLSKAVSTERSVQQQLETALSGQVCFTLTMSPSTSSPTSEHLTAESGAMDSYLSLLAYLCCR